jgi:hypothetical protein
MLDGEQIQAAFSRQNGCEIDRWDRLASVLQLEGPRLGARSLAG